MLTLDDVSVFGVPCDVVVWSVRCRGCVTWTCVGDCAVMTGRTDGVICVRAGDNGAVGAGLS